MEDLIACLYPFQDGGRRRARRVIKDTVNHSRRVEPRRQSPELPGQQSRETTAPLDDDDEKKSQPQESDPRLELRFSHPPKGGRGFVLGTDASSCDVVLPRLPNNNGQPLVSNQQLYITFDEQRRLIVQDTSSRGTIVTYDDKGGQKRRNFKWIIGGDPVPDTRKSIVIEIHPELKFQIVVSKHHLCPDLFFYNVDHFLGEVAANDQLPFGALGIESALTTAPASGRHTPNRRDTPKQDPILLKQGKLGEGSFSVVTRVWDVSTGLEHACKKFRNLRSSDWRKEAAVMRETSHEHILKLYFALEKPSPQLVLEYLPLGNLEDQDRLRNISESDVSTLLRQGSSALSYLHGQKPPIVHRDIKPENILVESRSPFRIKLADFGLAKADIYLETACGTFVYLAPEIARYYQASSTRGLRYTCAVDIWSLGVVIFQYGYGIPRRPAVLGLPWCKRIVKELNGWDSDSLLDIVSGMLIIDPKRRHSAEECLEKAWELERPQTPTAIPYQGQQCVIGESEPSIPDPTTVAFPTFQQDDSRLRDSKIQRYINSQVPHHSGAPAFVDDTPHDDSLASIRDSEIQGYIRSQVAHHYGAPAFTDAPTTAEKRRRSSRRSATSSSSARRTKRTVAASSRSRLQYENPSLAQDLQDDANYARYDEQNGGLGWDDFTPDVNAQDIVNDGQGIEYAGYSGFFRDEQNNTVKWDTFMPGIIAQGSVNDGQGMENAVYGRSFIEDDAQNNNLEWDAFAPGTSTAQNYGQSAGDIWTESFLAACLLDDMRR